jgi:HEAT repeat protein
MESEAQQTLQDLHHDDLEVRLRAIEKLASLRDPKYATVLIEMMGDPEWRVRKTAVMATADLKRGEPMAEQLIRVLFEEGNVGKRNAAEEALCLLGKVAIRPLLTHLPRANKDVKKMIIETLGEIADPRAMPELRVMLGDPDENVRVAAIESLGKIRDVRAVDALIPLLGDPNTLICFTTIKALMRLGDERAVEPIIGMAGRRGVERVALEALGSFSNPAVLDPILKGLRMGGKKVRESALKAMVDHAGRVSSENRDTIVDRLRREYDSATAEFLYGALENSDEGVRSGAVAVLGWLEDARAAAAIVRLIDGPLHEAAVEALVRMKQGALDALLQGLTGASEVTREGVAQILGERTDPRSSAALTRLLEDPNGHVRQTAATSLGKIGDPASATDILNLLSDQYLSVQESAIQALSRMNDPGILSRLVDLLGSDQATVRSNALKVIGKLKSAEAIPSLSFRLKDEDAGVRRSAVEALSEIHRLEVENLLLLALADEDPTVRLAALAAIGKRPEIDLIQHAGPLLTDDNIWVRAALARGLGDQRGEASKTLLLGMLKDKVGVVQIAAIEALGMYRDRRLIPAILEMTEQPDTDVVRSAVTVLGEVGDPDLVTRIQIFLKHRNWGVRAAAAEALGRLGDPAVRDSLERLAREDPDRWVQQTAQGALAQLSNPSSL